MRQDDVPENAAGNGKIMFPGKNGVPTWVKDNGELFEKITVIQVMPGTISLMIMRVPGLIV